MKYRTQLLLLLVTGCMSLPLVAEPTGTSAELPAIDEAAQKAQGSNRLRFRSGPVCMCSSGMSEQDIQRAQERQRRERRAVRE